MSKITDHEQAARLARAMASDVAIYNTEKIKRGIENDRLFQELSDDLREAKEMWKQKIDPEITDNTNLFQRAFIDEIFFGAAHIKSPIF